MESILEIHFPLAVETDATTMPACRYDEGRPAVSFLVDRMRVHGVSSCGGLVTNNHIVHRDVPKKAARQVRHSYERTKEAADHASSDTMSRRIGYRVGEGRFCGWQTEVRKMLVSEVGCVFGGKGSERRSMRKKWVRR